ncbi:MAG: hypothetical protein LQ340_004000 [Diploschistes diacapsis]|nr:MAG: hypothetical protein LQ340_004000 [Diploschistes diacapsis]
MAATEKARPQLASVSRSFSRYEPSQYQKSTRSRASTLTNELLSPVDEPQTAKPLPQDIFDNEEPSEATPIVKDIPERSSSLEGLPQSLDELPIELVSLTDRFISSLTAAKMYPTPPSIDKLAELFQAFYLRTESHISTHIQALASKQQRDASPAPSVSSRMSIGSKRSLAPLSSKPSRENLTKPDSPGVAQQMLTPSEISERRKARRMFEFKRVAIEEAVEKKVCEGIYDRIWRHSSSLDEIRDEKLRSKTAALALVGITMNDLGIQLDADRQGGMEPVDVEKEVDSWISKAREGLLQMNESHCPLGKLQSLTSTHQNIVDLLSIIQKSSSSADEILPTLIYTLISCPPEGINVVSNLNFIQRFRSANKMNGEAAYCLTNLEAAITFLENVDLATLRSEEAVDTTLKKEDYLARPNIEKANQIPGKDASAKASSPVTTPLTAVPPRLSPSPAPTNVQSPAEARSNPPASPSHQPRLSTLFQPSANAIGAASDAVRNSADQSLKNISTTLDSSFKFLFGRLKEQQVQSPTGDSKDSVLVPKTLDEARRLVSPKPVLDEDGNISEASSIAEPEDNAPREDRILDMITGKSRDRSADSATSATGKRVVLQNNENKLQTDSVSVSASPPLGGPLSAVESMRSFGNSLNPLNRLSGMNVMRGFGRSAGSSPAITPSPLASNDVSKQLRDPEKNLPPTARVEPPLERFLDVSNAGELRVSDVEALLKDYQRLAKIVRDRNLC